MEFLGLKPGAVGWQAQTNPLSYAVTPIYRVVLSLLLMRLIIVR